MASANNKNKKRYYIIGIGGVAMGNLAGLLKQKGHEVVGSDQESMYEPMKSVLQNLGIQVLHPFKESNIKKSKPGIMIVGNAISRGNPELEYAMSNGLLYRSVSDILREEFIDPPIGRVGGKKAIVVTGTHGKTTTTALIAWILEYAGLDPTIFVGGFMRNINSGFKLGNGKYIVLEGDEYNTAFFDKNPKFLGYRPYIGLINNIEFDHADIFKNIDEIKKTFSFFANLIPKDGLLSVNRENTELWDVMKHHKYLNANKQVISTFGLKMGDYTASEPKYTKDGRMMFQVKHRNKTIADISSGCIGYHNIANILGAISVARFVGIPIEPIVAAVGSFTGVKRRLEIIGQMRGITVFDDYAHHPTAVEKTISALKEAFPMKRVIAVFEPGSASSKKRIFEDQYFKAFLGADKVCLYKPYNSESMKPNERFSVKSLSDRLNKAHISSKYFTAVDKLLFHVKSIARSGDIVLVMSCRGFDGLREKLITEL